MYLIANNERRAAGELPYSIRLSGGTKGVCKYIINKLLPDLNLVSLPVPLEIGLPPHYLHSPSAQSSTLPTYLGNHPPLSHPITRHTRPPSLPTYPITHHPPAPSGLPPSNHLPSTHHPPTQPPNHPPLPTPPPLQHSTTIPLPNHPQPPTTPSTRPSPREPLESYLRQQGLIF